MKDNLFSRGPKLSRRHALGLGLGLMASTALPGFMRQAWAQQATGLPTFVPLQVEGGVTDPNPLVAVAFENYPKPYQTVAAPPGKGGPITGFVNIWSTAPPPKDQNQWMQQLDKNLGASWEPIYAPWGSYVEKLSTTLAGGQVPDVSWILPSFEVAARAIQDGAFADLTDALAGDNILKYPNLAHIPTSVWGNSTIEGRIFGVPRYIAQLNAVNVYRPDWAAKVGFSENPKNAEEIKAMLVGFSEGKLFDGEQTWGIGAFDGRMQAFFRNVFRVPAEWRVNTDGSFTNYIETDEFEAMLVYVADLWKSGVFHPDAILNQGKESYPEELFGTAKTGFMRTPTAGWYWKGVAYDLLTKTDPSFQTSLLITPGHDGGAPVNQVSGGWWGFVTAPGTASGERLEELLSVMNYFAAPFGSTEYTFLNYGIEGRHFTFDANGNPLPTSDQAALTEMNGNFFINPNEAVLYFQGRPNAAADAQAFQAVELVNAISDPSMNLLSATKIQKGGAVSQLNLSWLNDIVSGRRPVSDIAGWRQEWANAGGAAIRTELQESYARSRQG